VYQLDLHRNGILPLLPCLHGFEQHLRRTPRDSHHRLPDNCDRGLQSVRQFKIIEANQRHGSWDRYTHLVQDLVRVYRECILDAKDPIYLVLLVEVSHQG
jgi:hypothetical protein